MNFNVTVATDENGVWIVECPSIPGCVSQGWSKEVVKGTLRSLIRTANLTIDEFVS